MLCQDEMKSDDRDKAEADFGIRGVAELHDEELFKEHPPRDECPICFLPLPLDPGQTIFKSCCGKIICTGCIVAMKEEACGRGKISLCAFCREPNPSSDEEIVKRVEKLVEADNANAVDKLGGYYDRGVMGMPQDMTKANELWLRAGELGCAEAYYNLGHSYYNGRGVEVDKKKAKHFNELAAMNGSVNARHNLGCDELEAGNEHRAIKHCLLSARAGDKNSLDGVKQGFRKGIITKEEYANTLSAFQKIRDEMESDDRDKARARSVGWL